MFKTPSLHLKGLALYRLLTLALSGFFSLSGANLISEHYGLDSFADYSIILALILLLNFADFGFGLNLLKLAGVGISRLTELSEALSRSVRLISISSMLLSFLIFNLCVAGLITRILGIDDSSLNWSIFTFLVIGLAGTPFKLSYSVLYGTAKGSTVLTLQLISSFLLWILLVVASTIEMNFKVLTSLASTPLFITQFLGYLLIKKYMSPVSATEKVNPKWRVPKSALPYVLLLFLFPLPSEVSRIALNHFASDIEVSKYALLFVFFNAAQSIVQAGGHTMSARHVTLGAREQFLYLKTTFKLYLVLAALGAIGISTLSPEIIDMFMSRDIKFQTINLMLLSFLFFLYCVTYPLSMYLLTSTIQLRFLIACAVANVFFVFFSIFFVVDQLEITRIFGILCISYFFSTTIPVGVRTLALKKRDISISDLL